MNLHERKEEMRSFFNEKIETYDDVHSQFMETKSYLAKSLEGEVNKVLDLGSGTGLELIELFKKYPNVKVVAIDASEAMLEGLMNREFASNVTPICGDFFEVDFGDGYDAVISTSSLHHFTMKDKLELYKKILTSLKKQGVFVNCDKVSLTEEDQEYWFNEYENNRDAYKHIDTPLTIENEVSLLERAGFSNIKVSEVDKDNYRLFIAHK